MNTETTIPRGWQGCAVGLFGLLVLLAGPATAFKPEGHEEIERQAYAAMLTDSAPHYAGLSGPAALQQLIDAGFLQNSGTAIPNVLSGYPDLSLERQFFQDQQAYHFMASNQAVLQAIRNPTLTTPPQQQQRLLEQAYGECTRLTYFLYREILYNPTGARQAGRGTYVLMHIIGDSYSREHTERNAQYELATIKGWQLSRLSWPAPTGAVANWKSSFLHGVTGPLDHNWRQSSTTTDLSDDGTHARQAVVQLLTLLLEAQQHPDQVDSLWLAFVEHYLKPAGLELDQLTGVYRTSSSWSPTLPALYNVDPRGRGAQAGVLTIYDFDRSPGKYGGLVFQQGIHGTQASGLFFMFHISPGNTSGSTKLLSFWKRLPKSVEASWTSVGHRDSEGAWNRGGQFQLVTGTGFAVPVLNQVVLVPRAGIGFTPQDNQFQGIGGLELARSFGQAAFTPRAALGLEYDSGGIPARWSLYSRFGFNFWHGRMVRANP